MPPPPPAHTSVVCDAKFVRSKLEISADFCGNAVENPSLRVQNGGAVAMRSDLHKTTCDESSESWFRGRSGLKRDAASEQERTETGI